MSLTGMRQKGDTEQVAAWVELRWSIKSAPDAKRSAAFRAAVHVLGVTRAVTNNHLTRRDGGQRRPLSLVKFVIAFYLARLPAVLAPQPPVSDQKGRKSKSGAERTARPPRYGVADCGGRRLRW